MQTNSLIGAALVHRPPRSARLARTVAAPPDELALFSHGLCFFSIFFPKCFFASAISGAATAASPAPSVSTEARRVRASKSGQATTHAQQMRHFLRTFY
jgi:hypothetical protein